MEVWQEIFLQEWEFLVPKWVFNLTERKEWWTERPQQLLLAQEKEDKFILSKFKHFHKWSTFRDQLRRLLLLKKAQSLLFSMKYVNRSKLIIYYVLNWAAEETPDPPKQNLQKDPIPSLKAQNYLLLKKEIRKTLTITTEFLSTLHLCTRKEVQMLPILDLDNFTRR